jgi:hypothetical protein
MILGTLLTSMIIISGFSVAPWYYIVNVHSSGNCTLINNIVGADDGKYATIGQNTSTLGWVVIDLGSSNAMGANQDFTVFAQTLFKEEYNISVAETPEDDGWYLGSGDDEKNYNFTTPSDPGYSWRYIIIRGWSGIFPGDYTYGPDIDAVGWYSP